MLKLQAAALLSALNKIPQTLERRDYHERRK